MNYLPISLFAFCIATSFAAGESLNAGASLSLAGSWNVQLDPKDEGLAQTWFAAAHPFAGSMALPGTTDEAGLGSPANNGSPV